MVKWKLLYTNQAQKDGRKLASSGLKSKTLEILRILEEDPYQNSPNYEKLLGDLQGSYSRRINIQHRIVYQVLNEEKIIKILRIWTYYE